MVTSSLDGGSLTNVLMVTSSVWMLNWIHSNTTNLWPAVPLDLIFVVRTSSLQHRLINTSTSSNNTNHSSVSRRDNFLVARRKLYSGPLSIGIVSDNSSVITASPSALATISRLLLKIADNSTFGHVAHRHHISNGNVSFLSTINELSSVQAFSCNEKFLLCLIAVRITEVSNSKGSTTAGVMDNVLMTPLMYPCLSEKSTALRAGFPFLCLVWDTKMDPAPFLWARMTRPISLVEVNQAILAW